jgi:hypothetical protein
MQGTVDYFRTGVKVALAMFAWVDVLAARPAMTMLKGLVFFAPPLMVTDEFKCDAPLPYRPNSDKLYLIGKMLPCWLALLLICFLTLWRMSTPRPNLGVTFICTEKSNPLPLSETHQLCKNETLIYETGY